MGAGPKGQLIAPRLTLKGKLKVLRGWRTHQMAQTKEKQDRVSEAGSECEVGPWPWEPEDISATCSQTEGYRAILIKPA